MIKLFLILLFTVMARCESDSESITEECSDEICLVDSKNILLSLDESIDPCDDFYTFACGNFLNNTKIPDDETSVGAVTLINEKLVKQINEILSSPIADEEPKAFASCKKLYKACVDEESIEKRGLKPIKSIIESLGGWPILEGKNWMGKAWPWQKMLSNLDRQGLHSDQMFTVQIDTDLKNSSKRMLYVDQPGLCIDREYLIKGFEDDVVQAYYNYHVDTAVYFGADRFNAEIDAKDVLNFEIDMAKILTPKEQRRNMTLMYNPITIKEFQLLFPIHDWYKYLNSLLPKSDKLTENEEIILTDFKFIVKKVYELLKKTPNRVLVNHLIWHTVSSTVDLLGKEIRDRSLDFSKVITGKQSFEPRWKECANIVKKFLPIATSALYVRNFFKNESREIALEMVNSIREEFVSMLSSVTWMDESTRAAALEKAKTMVSHIGYPDELMDDSKLNKYYEGLTIDEEKYFESIIRINQFLVNKTLNSFRKLINKTDWETHSDVAVINAFYNPIENNIQFPAGILQGIFFHPERPRYMNFGSIGFVIGHEITHGFDDEGSQFDSDGNLVDWWKEETKKAFLEKAQCIIDQYSNFTEPTVQLNLNGINTQGENIADNGGVKTAYLAYQKFVMQSGSEKLLPWLNYTANQLFWISAAQTWCSVSREASIKQQILLDPHSPSMFRVNGPLKNMAEFSEDFQCPEGSQMNTEEKCDVW